VDGPSLGVQAVLLEVDFDRHSERLLIMRQIVRVGLDIAKRWFQVRGVDDAEKEVFNRKLPRDKVLGFLGALPPCEVALEACSSSHHRGREIERLGHRVRLISPNYVKPFVKRGKSDAHDARHLRGGVATRHAVRSSQNRGAAGGVDAAHVATIAD
jgi:hypothetical protein